MSFSDRQVQKLFKQDFVSTYTNISGDPTAGMSFSHAPDEEPGLCGRGAGRQNVQTLFMTSAGKIFHVATGFLAPEDLIEEARIALELHSQIRTSKNPAEATSELQVARLLKQGFEKNEIQTPDNMFSKMMMSGPNPQDMGLQMPRMNKGNHVADQLFGNQFVDRKSGKQFGNQKSGNQFVNGMFGDVSRQRKLADGKFVVHHPLMDAESFNDDPGLLVGNHKSFFGTQGASNKAIQGFNRAMQNRR